MYRVYYLLLLLCCNPTINRKPPTYVLIKRYHHVVLIRIKPQQLWKESKVLTFLFIIKNGVYKKPIKLYRCYCRCDWMMSQLEITATDEPDAQLYCNKVALLHSLKYNNWFNTPNMLLWGIFQQQQYSQRFPRWVTCQGRCLNCFQSVQREMFQ